LLHYQQNKSESLLQKDEERINKQETHITSLANMLTVETNNSATIVKQLQEHTSFLKSAQNQLAESNKARNEALQAVAELKKQNE